MRKLACHSFGLAAAATLLCLTRVHADRGGPIIGILALPIDHGDCVTFRTFLNGTSCFHSLYVKWLEAAGARVVPIPYDLPTDAFVTLVSSLNGALITGGETNIKSLSSLYMQAAGRLYEHAIDSHTSGETWPLWGTCMGMQVRRFASKPS